VYEPPVVATARITRVIKPGLFEATLPNGKVTTCHLSKALAETMPELEPGHEVTVELTPFDFDSARISAIADT
jgi:translation initiation factor IF-1